MFTWKPQEFELYPPMQIGVKKCLKEYAEVSFSLRCVFCQNRWWRRYERECLFKLCCCATIQREWYLKYGNWYNISFSPSASRKEDRIHETLGLRHLTIKRKIRDSSSDRKEAQRVSLTLNLVLWLGIMSYL